MHLWLFCFITSTHSTTINYFSSGLQGALFASLIPGLNIIRMLLLGLGVYQDEGTIKSMSRHGDRRFAEFHIISPFFFCQFTKCVYNCSLNQQGTTQGTALLCNRHHIGMYLLLEDIPNSHCSCMQPLRWRWYVPLAF